MKKRLLPLLLCSIIFTVGISTSLPTSAIYMTNKDFILPEGYTEYTDKRFSWISDLTTFYRKDDNVNDTIGTSLIMLSNFHFNYTVFQTADPTSFEAIYEKFSAKLNFDNFSSHTNSEGITSYYMSDLYDENGERSKDPADFSNKQDLLWQMTQELKASDLLLYSDYQFCRADLGIYTYDHLIILNNLPLADKDTILQKIKQYDSETTFKITDSENTFECWVEDFDSFDDALTLSNEIKDTYSNAIANPVLSSTSSNTTSAQSKSIDLMTAQRQGDPNNDTEVTPDDAYQALCYYAKKSVGAEDAAFTDNSDEAKEAAAFAAADVNGDGIINGDDAYLILKYYAEKSVGGTPSWD